MEAFTIAIAILTLLLTAIGIRVAINIAKRQGAYRREQLLLTVSIPQLLPMGNRVPAFSKVLGPPGAVRMASVYPVVMQPPPCVAVNISQNMGKHIFFLPITVCNNGDKPSNEVTLRLVTSSNIAAEKTTELGEIKGVDTDRRIVEDHGELQITHDMGTIKAFNCESLGEVFSIDPEEHRIGERSIRVMINIHVQSTDAHAQAQIILFLVRADSKLDLMQSLAYHAKMEHRNRTTALGRILSFGRANKGRPSLWVFPDYQTMPDGVHVHKFNQSGDKTEAGLLLPAPFGQFMEI